MFIETLPVTHRDMLGFGSSFYMRCPVSVKITFVILCFFCLGFILPPYNNPIESHYYRSNFVTNDERKDAATALPDSSAFHLLVPATTGNKQLCKLLLSSSALGYPSPTFINWNSVKTGQSEYSVHMDKVKGILNYLDAVAPENEQDLVLILDGYDIWLQLRPELMLKRYFSILDQSHQRLAAKHGKETIEELGIYNSVVFGADKICWPEDPARMGCWAVPESPLPRYAFGPDTDYGRERNLNRPRWLNSGTILGPIKDVRAIFRATLYEIQTAYTIDSDQMYFSNVWGRQEYARTIAAHDEGMNSTSREMWIQQGWMGEGFEAELRLDTAVIHPDIKPKQPIDLHITLDYEGAIFQTMAFYYPYISWIHYSEDKSSIASLPQDLVDSLPPLHNTNITQNAASRSWFNIPLSTNTVTKQIPALLHFTPPKALREIHWSRMWFYPYARWITKASQPATSTDLLLVGPDGRKWYNYESPHAQDIASHARFSGGFADSGGWLSWKYLCSSHEEAVFNNLLEENDRMPERVGGWLRPPVGIEWNRPQVAQPQ